jgi:hypothetical protein
MSRRSLVLPRYTTATRKLVAAVRLADRVADQLLIMLAARLMNRRQQSWGWRIWPSEGSHPIRAVGYAGSCELAGACLHRSGRGVGHRRNLSSRGVRPSDYEYTLQITVAPASIALRGCNEQRRERVAVSAAPCHPSSEGQP